MFDYLIKNGTIIDGTGDARFQGDIAIQDDRIVAVGTIDGEAKEIIDATGLVVAPGFVDPHTHYDAQLFWDPRATPSNLHGVTSAVMGNCGFTLAPVNNEQDADYLRRMMVKVEGMPLEALETGVSWDWNSYGEYLSKLEGNIGLNVATMVGHCALRLAVMGPDSTKEIATPEQVAEMQSLLKQCIEEGGLGFSTTRAFTHNDGNGDPVPSRVASEDELLALCAVVADHEGTTLEWASDGCLNGFTDDEVELMANMSLAGRRPLNWNVLTVDSARPSDYKNQLKALETCTDKGARVVALTMPVLVGMNMSFLTYCGLNMMPDWGPILGLPVAERMEKLRDPETRRFMEERAASPDAGVFSRLTGWGRYIIGDTYSEANEGLKGKTVGEIALERGVRDFYCLLDIVLADELRTVLWPGPTDDDPASWHMRTEAWQHPDVMIGGSDAGAHLDRMSGAPYTTSWLHDCLHGKSLISLEETINHITQVPAELFGLRDRGVLKEGTFADIVIFNPETINAGEVILLNDLPGGEGRLYADVEGMHRVFVNGIPTVVDNEPTDHLPGTVLKSGRDTYTVAIPADA
ncbi:MAG: amidohydrolase family protein [Actinomycetota bacterium]|nr:amidohydrolase family protein [Actinomycetota bacterium]MEC8120262.1 amidohydrolase family protein [Actinomycetota bacterium]